MKPGTGTLVNGAVVLVVAALAPAVVWAAGPAQVLYVGNDVPAGQVLQYSLPLTAGSTPDFGIASPNAVAVATDAGGILAVGDNAGRVVLFTPPLSGASTPAVAFANGAATNDGQLAFAGGGDLWAATFSNQVNGFRHPFTIASTPSAAVNDPALVSAIGTAFDAAQNLYVSNAGTGTSVSCGSGAGTCSDLLVYPPPYTRAPTVTPNVAGADYRKLAVTATRLYAASVAGGRGRVDVYDLPLTASSVPAFALSRGVATPEGLAVDAAGDLYVGNLSGATIAVYRAPITAASVPSLIYRVSVGTFALFGIAIGSGPATAPTPPIPNSGFTTVSRAVDHRTGSVTFKVAVNDPGTLRYAVAFANRGSGVRAGGSFRAGSTTASGAGTLSFKVAPGARARRALKASRRGLALTVRLTFQSLRGGAPVRQTVKLTDKLA